MAKMKITVKCENCGYENVVMSQLEQEAKADVKAKDHRLDEFKKPEENRQSSQAPKGKPQQLP